MPTWVFWALLALAFLTGFGINGHLARIAKQMETSNIMLSDVRALLSNWSDQQRADLGGIEEELKTIRGDIAQIETIANQFRPQRYE